ncbi:MAG: T6SS effector amidase Tae4 family protein [Polaribacter sp.]|uniref:T6SS effector amidase Tae4 family protein n=1 Tax=Polaribacter sp. TaxID=1920175 RepID=UPI002F35B688
MKRRKITNYLKFGILFLGISVLLQNCEKENNFTEKQLTPLSEIKARKISFEEVKEVSGFLESTDKFFNKFSDNTYSERSIDSNDGNFVILTDEIIEVVKDSVVTLSFMIKEPTNSDSSFENFIIKKVNDTFEFYIYKYKFNPDNIDFKYSLETQAVSEDQIDIEEFQSLFQVETLAIAGDCLVDVAWDNGCGCSFVTVIFCDNVDEDNNGGDPSNNNSSSDATNNDDNTDSNNSNAGGGSTGNNSTGNGNTDSSTSAGVVLSPTAVALSEIYDCLDLNPVLGGYFASQTDTRGYNSLAISIKNYMDNSGGCSSENSSFIIEALQFLKDNPQYNFVQYENWFGTEHDGIDYEYDADYWEDPNLTFTPQDLPSWADYYANFPRKAGGGWLYGANNIYNLVGGDVLQVREDDVDERYTNNTCALKVSIALNGSGIIIPEIITSTTSGVISYGTVKGADGKNYFLNAKSLNKWMRLTFGVSPSNPKHFNYTKAQGGVGGKNFPSLIGTKKGIYSLTSSSTTWASGHADIFFENICSVKKCYYSEPSLESIDIWVLD